MNENEFIGKAISRKLYLLIQSNKLIFLNLCVLLFQLSQYNYAPHHIRFFPFLIDGTFTLFSFSIGFFVLAFIILRRNIWAALLIGQILGAAMMFILWNRHLDTYYYINQMMDDFTIRWLWRFNFMMASINDGSQLWAFMIGLYGGIFALIYGNWFVKNKKFKDGYWKVERQVVWTGMGVYGIINISIWVFTHFGFVGSNYIYMENILKYVDSIVEQYDKNNQTSHFALKDLQIFNNYEELEAYYQDPKFLEKTGGPDRKDFHKFVLGNISTIKKYGIYNPEQIGYDKIGRFHEWMGVVFNISYSKGIKEQKKFWQLELSPVIRIDPKYQDVTRHSLFYIKEREDGKIYSYFNYDRSFKDSKQNYIFNFFFGFFHLVFIPLFLYLIYLHRRDNLKKSAIANQMYSDKE